MMMLAAAAMLAACEESGKGDGGSVSVNDLVISFDKSVIMNNSSDVVTFRAFYKGEEVSDSGASFFQIVGSNYNQIDRRFSTSVAGEYSFQVAYGALYSDVIKITAIDREIPALPNDPQSSNLSFVHRTFFNQHTGAQCPNCPFMTYLLKQTLTDGYEDKVVLASLRNYGGENGFANVPNPASSWPYLHVDYTENVQYNSSPKTLQAKIDAIVAEPAKVGISASPKYYEDGQVIVKVAVKAAEAGEYNVGLWLMQDNYKKTQTVDMSRVSLLGPAGFDDSYHYHDNCVRVAESKYLGAHVGYSLGKMQKGETKEWVFLVNVNLGSKKDLNDDGKLDHNDGSWWEGKSKVNLADLRFAAFVTTPTSTSRGQIYKVVNAVQFPYDQPLEFDYIR